MGHGHGPSERRRIVSDSAKLSRLLEWLRAQWALAGVTHPVHLVIQILLRSAPIYRLSEV
jgi:hypothetical protein